MQQDYLRKRVRLAKACNEDIKYKHFAEFLNISEASFYNWLSGKYKLSRKNEQDLNHIVIDLIDIE